MHGAAFEDDNVGDDGEDESDGGESRGRRDVGPSFDQSRRKNEEEEFFSSLLPSFRRQSAFELKKQSLVFSPSPPFFSSLRPLQRLRRVFIVPSARVEKKNSVKHLRSPRALEQQNDGRSDDVFEPVAVLDNDVPSSPSVTARRPSTTSQRSCSCRPLRRSTTCAM